MIKIAGSIAALGTVIAMAFGAWFAVTDAIGMEAKTRQLAVESLRYQNLADDLDFEIWRVDNDMTRIERRRANGIKYHGDERRLKGLERDLDILLKRQETLQERLQEEMK